MAKATSVRETLTSWPSLKRVRYRSAAKRPTAAVRPVAVSQAGSTWLVGIIEPEGPVA